MSPEEAELENVDDVQVCQNCGKRVSAGRSGSFTQWVFRSDLCGCEKPDVFDSTAHGGNAGGGGGKGSFAKNIRGSATTDEGEIDDDSEDDSAPELEVDPSAFPTDRYKPIALLDKGASGVVYLSRDRLLGTKIAVKCLRALSADQLIAFQNEARATSKLNHENIVKVLNFGATEGGAPYMVMEYIDGITLKGYVEKHGPLPLPLAIKVFTQICDALRYAHGKEIFHRDLKSSNIMLANLHAYLIDFGVAMVKHATQEPTIVQGKTVVGTPAYMAPDQSIGKTYDQRSEIYSLGCVMFEVLSGDLPFSAETALELISMHASQTAPRLSEVNERIDYPQELEVIVAKCLEKDPNKRFQSVDELSNALGELTEAIDTASGAALTQSQENKAVAGSSRGRERRARPTDKKKFLVIGCICVFVLSIGVFYLTQIWEKELKPPTTNKRMTKRQKREKEFADKFTIISDPRLTTIENKGPIDDDDLRLISDITPKGGTYLAVELKGSPNLTGRKFKYLPANISSLDFYGSGIKDDELKNLGTRAELLQLGIVRTPVSKEGLKQLSLPGLQGIDVSFCHDIDDDAIKIIVNNWRDLQYLALTETKITSRSISYIKRLTRLKILSLNGTSVNDKDMERLSKLPLLEELAITNTAVTDKGLDILTKMTQLKALGLVGSLNVKEPAILKFMKQRPDVAVRGRSKQEELDFYFSPEGGDVRK